MSDCVEIPDDGSDVELQEQSASLPGGAHTTVTASLTGPMVSSSFDELKTLKREMEFRGSLLGKTWSELTRIMTKYQTQLIHKHEQFQTVLGAGEQGRLSELESLVEKRTVEFQRMEKSNSDLEQKLLEKDGEIVRLRTEVHKLRNEVSMKDSLIAKLQNQMAKEAMEYSTEISSLKEILEMENNSTSSTPPVTSEINVAKKRKIGPRSKVVSETPQYMPSESLAFPKDESPLQSCQLQGSRSSSDSSSADTSGLYSHQTMHLPKNHTQTLAMHGSHLEPGYSDSITESMTLPTTSVASELNPHDALSAHPDDNAAFYKLDELRDDSSKSGDVMADLMEQKPGAILDPSMMIPNVHSMPPGQQQSPSQQVPHHNRKQQNQYSDEIKREIGIYAIRFGTRKAARHFTERYGINVPVSTVQEYKRRYGHLT